MWWPIWMLSSVHARVRVRWVAKGLCWASRAERATAMMDTVVVGAREQLLGHPCWVQRWTGRT